jgi:hypothetical protein
MSNVTVPARSAGRESVNLLKPVVSFLARLLSAIRCANALETRRTPAQQDLARLNLQAFLSDKSFGD